jgi:DNA-binding HxlR family transcriptional regulator
MQPHTHEGGIEIGSLREWIKSSKIIFRGAMTEAQGSDNAIHDYFEISSLDPAFKILVELSRLSLRDSVKGGLFFSELARKLGIRKDRIKKKLDDLEKLGLVAHREGRYVWKVPTIVALKLLDVKFPQLSMEDIHERNFIPRTDIHEMPDEGETRPIKPDSVFSVHVPGSILLSGDHSVLLGLPAVALPIPLYVNAGADVSYTDQAVEEIRTRVWYGGVSENLQLDELKTVHIPIEQGTPQKFGRYENKIKNAFIERLDTRAKSGGGRIKSVTITIENGIPPKCGLGSSGAVSAALAILLDACSNGTPAPVEKWSRADLVELRRDRRFMQVFRDAIEFEKMIQGRSPTVNCFAGLVGSPDGTPFLYRGDYVGRRFRLHDFERLPKKYVEKWKADFGIALISTTTEEREPSEGLYLDEKYIEQINKKEFQDQIRTVTKKLWDEMNEKDGPHWGHVVTCVQVHAAYESGFLGRMQSESEEYLRQLCGYFSASGLGAKYCDLGAGRDLLVVGPPDKLKASLFHNCFPLHYATFVQWKPEGVIPKVETL